MIWSSQSCNYEVHAHDDGDGNDERRDRDEPARDIAPWSARHPNSTSAKLLRHAQARIPEFASSPPPMD
jgi:hypothetical protein